MQQVKSLISDLQSKHKAEKTVLELNQVFFKGVIRSLIHKVKQMQKTQRKSEIKLLQLKRLQELNMYLKSETGRI